MVNAQDLHSWMSLTGHQNVCTVDSTVLVDTVMDSLCSQNGENRKEWGEVREGAERSYNSDEHPHLYLPISFLHSLPQTHTLTHPRTHSLTHSLPHSSPPHSPGTAGASLHPRQPSEALARRCSSLA